MKDQQSFSIQNHVKVKQYHPEEYKQIVANKIPKPSYVHEKENKKKIIEEKRPKSPPEILIAETPKDNDFLKPAAATSPRKGKISEEVLSLELRLESQVEDVSFGTTSGLFGDLGIPSVGENTDNRYAISATAGGEGDSVPMTLDYIAANAFDGQNTMGLRRTMVEENRAFYEQFRALLYAPADINDQNEYILMPDDEWWLPCSVNELFRRRLKHFLFHHNELEWWVHQDAGVGANLEEFIVILCHMVDNDAWCIPSNPNDIVEIDWISKLIASLWPRIKRSLRMLDGNWRERAGHVENMVQSLVNCRH